MPSTNNRSPLKWAGGKSKLLDTIFDNVPADVEKKRFVDVFSGSGIVGANAAERGFAKVWLNDFNSDLVNLYKCLKSNPARLYQMLKKVLTAENSNERRYYELRTEFNR